MKLHASGPGPHNTITGYGDGYVMVNGERRDSSLILTRDKILDWPVRDFFALTSEAFQSLEGLDVDIVVLGTGARQRFPDPRLTASLSGAGMGLEVMDLKAACRTYNILVAEERKVAAALLFG